MHREDPIDRMLTIAGFVALGALVLLLLGRHARRSLHVHLPEAIGGGLKVNGPMRVQGDLWVGGPATVHGAVEAHHMTIGGSIDPSLPTGEKPGPAGQSFAKSLAVGGPLTVQGPLRVDGALVVGGPLTSEAQQLDASGSTDKGVAAGAPSAPAAPRVPEPPSTYSQPAIH